MRRKYRVEHSVAGLRSAVEEGLLNYVKRLSRRYENVEHRLLIWKTIMKRLELRLQDLKRQGFQDSPSIGEEGWKELYG